MGILSGQTMLRDTVIDGSKALYLEQSGDDAFLVITEDGRKWYWYREDDVNYGEWKQYNPET
jgi:hypothetical protein